jgi:dihydrofolate reductase/thymidylate synthase
MFNLVVATDKNNGIGKNGTIPWNCPDDMKHFKEITSYSPNEKKQNVVVMGRKTWQSIPIRYRPLSNRINIVLSRSVFNEPGGYGCQNIQEVFDYVKTNIKKIHQVFIIGGAEIYKQFYNTGVINKIYKTVLDNSYNCDTFIDSVPKDYKLTSTKQISKGVIEEYQYQNVSELNYLSVMQDILTNGLSRNDRTQVGTLSLFGKVLSWDVRNGILPLLTTKRTFYRGIAEELLWFLKGSTDAKQLQEKNVHIWDGNSSRQFLDSRNLHHYETGDAGAIYGFQLRHFGAHYESCNTDYSDKGFDQLQYVIDTIKNDPHSRRILFSYWNPNDFDKMSLYPCHILYQFYVDTEAKTLSCNLYQRSSDYFLANNFNVVSAVILMHMIGKLTGYTPHTLNHMMGDVHLYKNHIEQCKKQLKRIPSPFPTFKIVGNQEQISDFTIDDFVLENYYPQPGIKADMAV